MENYKELVTPHLMNDDQLIIVDTSEIIKPYSKKLERLGHVRDGSTNKIEKGYWTVNMVAITDKSKHPLPLYSHLYSSSEDEFISANEETSKGLRHVRSVLGEKKATFVMDREFDNVEVMKNILKQEDHFIIRLKRNRHLLYQNKKLSVRDLSLRRKGKVYNLKVSHIAVEIPSMKGTRLTMVAVYGYGKDPMVLLTSKQVRQKDDVLSILKGYILRWRIEEMFRVQKQEFQLESICVRTLKRLNRLLLFVSMMTAFMSLKTEK